MASSANPGALTSYDISTMYFQFYSFSAKTAHDIACLMHKIDYKFSVEHEASQNSLINIARKHIIEGLKVTYEAGSFGRYLARGQTDLVELKKAIKIEDLAEVDAKLDQMTDELNHKLYPHHPARENSKVWEAAVAQVVENFTALRVPVDEQLVLYYDFHGLKLETIHAILSLKQLSPSSKWHLKSKRYLEDLIARAKKNFEETGGQPQDPQSLAEYLARGHIDHHNDLNKATTLTLEEMEKIAHIEKVDENHEADSSKSKVNRIASKIITDNVEAYQA